MGEEHEITPVAMRSLHAKSEEKQIVWGAVYSPGVPDTHGDYMTAEDIEEMAYDFMKDGNLGAIDVMHDNKTYDCYVVESFIVQEGVGDAVWPIIGTWVVAVKIPSPELWSRVKEGKLNGFSMEVLARRVPGTVVIDTPAMATGETYEADGHKHSFEVWYDEKGKLVGGRTNDHVDADGNVHYHVISKGTATQKTAGHSHRFAFIDNLVGVGSD